MSVDNPAPAIFVYEDFYKESSQLLEEVNKAAALEFSACPWIRATLGENKEISEYRSNLESSVSRAMSHPDPDFEPLKKEMIKFLKPLDRIIIDYRAVFQLYLTRDTGFSILRYENSMEYKFHHDHSSLNQRVLSMIFFMNDNYEGGELEFPYHEVTIEPKAGKLVIFPANFPYSHIAHPIKSGTKYTMVTWYQ